MARCIYFDTGFFYEKEGTGVSHKLYLSPDAIATTILKRFVSQADVDRWNAMVNNGHPDIAQGSNISISNTNGSVIQNLVITLDSNGHVIVSSASSVNLDNRYSLSNHTHNGYEPAISKDLGYAKWTGFAWSFVNESYSLSSHNHSGVYATASHDHNGTYLIFRTLSLATDTGFTWGTNSVTATAYNDTLKLVAGTNVTLETDETGKAIRITATGGGLGGDTFKTWHTGADSGYTWGSSDVVASGADTMDVIPGSNISVSTDATLKAIKISVTGITSFPGFGTDHSTAAYGDHTHAYEPSISKSTGYLTWTGAAWSFLNQSYSLSTHDHSGVYSPTGHDHSGVYEPAISKSTGYLKWTGAAWSFANETYALSTHTHPDTYYYAGTMTVNTGVLDSGAVGDLDDTYGNYVSISEATGADPLRVTLTFTAVTSFTIVAFRAYYSGGATHHINVEIYNKDTTNWDLLTTLQTDTAYKWYSVGVFDSSSYVNSGSVQVRFCHVDNGVNTHDLFIDYVTLKTGSASGGVTHHGMLSGLADDDHTQYHTDARGDARYLIFKTFNLSADSGFTWGTSDVVADAYNDTLKLVAGTGITIDTDATNDAIRINSSIANYWTRLAPTLSPATANDRIKASTDNGYAIWGTNSSNGANTAGIFGDCQDTFPIEGRRTAASANTSAGMLRLRRQCSGGGQAGLGGHISWSLFNSTQTDTSDAAKFGAAFTDPTAGSEDVKFEWYLMSAGSSALKMSLGDDAALVVYGTVRVGNAYTLPSSIGSDGQVLKVPAAGTVLEWYTPSASGDTFKTWHYAADSGYSWGTSDVVASSSDTMDIVAGTNVTIQTDATAKAIKISATAGSADTFKTWHTGADSGYSWGSSDVVASGNDTMDIIPGSNIAIATDATAKAVKVSVTGITSFPGFGTDHSTAAYGDHTHAYEPTISKSAGYLTWTGAAWSWKNETYSLSGHDHSGVYEPAISKSTGYLKWTGAAWSFANETYSLSTHNHDSTYLAFKTINLAADTGFTWAATDVVADLYNDTLKLVAGTNITIQTDAANDAIKISAAHPDISPGTSISSSNTNGTVIQSLSVTIDTDGHVTATSVSTLDLDTRHLSFRTLNFPADSGFTWASSDVVADLYNDTLKIVAGTGITLASDAANDAFRITCSLTVPTKATGAEIDTGTDDAKFATPKAIADSKISYTDGTETLTNKRINQRESTTTSSATPTPDVSACDIYTVTAQAVDATWGSPTGTPVQGQKLILRMKSNTSSHNIAFNAIYRAVGVTLPTTLAASKTQYIGCIYNSTDAKWDVVAVSTEA